MLSNHSKQYFQKNKLSLDMISQMSDDIFAYAFGHTLLCLYSEPKCGEKVLPLNPSINSKYVMSRLIQR